MTYWSFSYVLRSVALILAFVVLLRYSLHWFFHIRRTSRLAQPQQLLEFFQQEGRFYGRQVILCLVTLLISTWSYNLHRPPKQNYSPNQVYEVQVGDRNGSWEIGFGAIEVAIGVALLWGLWHRATVAVQIRMLWVVREQLQLDMHEYKLRP
jgi:hypothetical protein